jgi:hypothetical protein
MTSKRSLLSFGRRGCTAEIAERPASYAIGENHSNRFASAVTSRIRNFGEMQKAESGDFNARARVTVNSVFSTHYPSGLSLALN